MKKLILTAVIIVSCLSFKNVSAQIHLSIGVNIGNQPEWGPVGYDHADYYYIPDVNAYYDVNAHQYVYIENNQWVHRTYLPVRYRNYDLYHAYKAVINERNPWLHNQTYRTRYNSYRGRRDQLIIRDSRDVKYRQHWRGAQDNRARQLNQRDHKLDQRAKQLNQRDHKLDQRAKELKKKEHNDHH